jgi:hypothetical protein
MGFLKNLANKAAIRATRNELNGLKAAINELPVKPAGDIFLATANLRGALSELLPSPYGQFFSVSVMSPRVDFQNKEQIREGVARLLPELTELERDSNDAMTKWGIYFWRVALMAMLHDELYEEGRSLWLLVLRIEGDVSEAKFDAEMDAMLDENLDELETELNEEDENEDEDEDETPLYHLRPLYYLTGS